MENIWLKTLEEIKKKISESEYSAWFSRLKLGEEKNGELTLYVPSAFFKDSFTSRYLIMTQDTLSDIANKKISIKVELETKTNPPETTVKTQKEIKEQKQGKDTKSKQECLLNPAYTFDSFVPGENCSFAYNAALSIAKNPGSTYNPCLIYGGVGLGKTHLLQSIGNYLQQNSDLKVQYVTCENFTNEFIQSIQPKTTSQFQKKYRKVSVLLMDDIQFIQGKVETQNEMFNTFNDLYDTGRQIVFTSDRPVEELKNISDRLRSRFSRGLCIDIQPPNYETRVAILQAKCKERKFPVNSEVLEYIAKNIYSNVRALESCITKLMAYSELLNKDISLETAKEQLKQIINANSDSSGISMDLIIKIVAAYYNISPYDIKGKNRGKSIIIPRQVAMYLCRSLTDYSTTEIASEFGGKNHTTVIYNVQKIKDMINTEDSEMEKIITKLSNQIKQEIRKN